MRVLYVNQTGDVSGAERSLLSLLSGLEGAVDRVVACPDGQLPGELAALGIRRERVRGTQASFRMHPVHTTRGVLDIGRSTLDVAALSHRLAPAVVHANTTRAALLAAAPARPPLLAHIRDWVPEGRVPGLVLDVVGRRADMVVANSAFVAGQFDGVRTRGPVRVVHNPVDLDRFDPAAADGAAVRAELGLGAEARVLTVVAQITPWKGQDDAIRTLAGLGPEHADAVLLIAGSAKFAAAGAQYDNPAFERLLHDLAAELGVAERVRFLGERDDVPAVLAASDLLLLPSWQEAFGRTAIEAMALGLPVVATSAGGPAEIIEPGVQGLLVAPKRPDLWAAAVGPLLDSEAERRAMGEEALRRARDFGIAAHAAAMLELYRELSDDAAARSAAR